jgi:hypothetical protein
MSSEAEAVNRRDRRLAVISALLGFLTVVSFGAYFFYVIVFTRAGREPGNVWIGGSLAILHITFGILSLLTGVLALKRLPKTLTNMEHRGGAWFGAVVGFLSAANNVISFWLFWLDS